MKKKQLLNDFVSCEEYCNLSCAYCLSEGANLKSNHNFERVNGKLNYKHDDYNNKILVYKECYNLKQEIDSALKAYNDNFDAPIFKISGGEVTIIEGIEEILRDQSSTYDSVQLLTNGILLTKELIKKLSLIDNLSIQLSLDGHTFEMNKCRYLSQAACNNVLKNLDLLVDYNINVEIYSVLTNINIEKFDGFLDYILEKYNNKVFVIPFPVRLLGAKKYFPKVEQLEAIKKIIQEYEKYEEILPGKEYIKEMYFFMKNKERKTRCFVPLITSQLFDDGVITPCPNCWTVNIGNIVKSVEDVKKNMDTHPIYRQMLSKEPMTNYCKQCFTDYHVFNLFFNGTITLEELIKNRKSLQGELVVKRLREFKEIIDSEEH